MTNRSNSEEKDCCSHRIKSHVYLLISDQCFRYCWRSWKLFL